MIIFTLLFKRLVRKVANVLYATLIRAHVQEEIELFWQIKAHAYAHAFNYYII